MGYRLHFTSLDIWVLNAEMKKSGVERLNLRAFNSVGKENNLIPIPSDVDKCAISNSPNLRQKRQYTFVQVVFFFFHFGWFHNYVPSHYL
jgi:hypothetical protein